jgi:hypothetical protein
MNINQLIRVITLCGYFPSVFELYDKDDNLLKSFNYKLTKNKIENEIFLSNLEMELKESFYTQIIIESKFNKSIEKIPNKLYHVATYDIRR